MGKSKRLVFLGTGFLGGMLLLLWGMLLWATSMPGQSLQGELPALSVEQQAVRERLQQHVQVLAADIGERHHNNMPALNRAADYIQQQLRALGYEPLIQQFGDKDYRNIVVEVPASGDSGEIIVIGAHYDSWLTPGADDNASGVAVLLELARAFAGQSLPRTLRFVAFPNEERPFFGTEAMGSRVSAALARARGDRITAMFSLEMLGYYSSEAGSQHYPPVIDLRYPDTANFIAFIANVGSATVMRRAIAYFRGQSLFPAEGMAAPQWLVPDIRRSDNSAYWYYDYPAVMVTDTSNFRNPNYHSARDTVATLDYDSMARVLTGLRGMFQALASE
ncbi:MAG: M20/M25/M40 family metallo-hydrolase [Pseudomonadales bacterium]|nr:M20/M25/M40 family metallo-hydrolase [Pseudomonadales bacterium]